MKHMVRNRTVGVVVAVEDSIISLLWGEGKIVQENPFGNIRKFRVGDMDIYVVKSGAGEIKAAAATQYLIDWCGVEMIANYGVAGACTDDLRSGESVIVNGVVHYDYDLSEIDGTPTGRYEDFTDVVMNTDDRLLRLSKLAFPGMKQAICASGDKFLSYEQKQWCNSQFGAQVCDMEAAGILLTCHRNRIPCLIVKTVADGLTGGGTEYWDVKEKAAEAGLRVLQVILKDV